MTLGIDTLNLSDKIPFHILNEDLKDIIFDIQQIGHKHVEDIIVSSIVFSYSQEQSSSSLCDDH